MYGGCVGRTSSPARRGARYSRSVDAAPPFSFSRGSTPTSSTAFSCPSNDLSMKTKKVNMRLTEKGKLLWRRTSLLKDSNSYEAKPVY